MIHFRYSILRSECEMDRLERPSESFEKNEWLQHAEDGNGKKKRREISFGKRSCSAGTEFIGALE